MGDLKPSMLWRHFLARALQNIRGLIKLLTRNTPEKTSLLSGPMDIAEWFLGKAAVSEEAEKRGRWRSGVCRIKGGRKERVDEQIHKSKSATSDLFFFCSLAWITAKKQTSCVMLTLATLLSESLLTSLISVPALFPPSSRPPFPIHQKPAKPSNPSLRLSSLAKVLKYRPLSEKAFSDVLFSGHLWPRCVLTSRPLPVWGHWHSGNIHHREHTI